MMKLEGKYRFQLDRETVWKALNNPDVLQKATPGCKEFEQVGPDEYAAVLEMGVAGIKGRYKGKVAIADRQEPDQYRLIIEGAGTPGFVKASVTFSLTSSDPQTTELAYSGDAQVGGMVAAVGQRVLGGVVKMTMEQFFKAVEQSASQ